MLALTLTLTLPVAAQVALPPLVSIRGMVTDGSGTVLPYAIVAFDSAGRGIGRPTQTNDAGDYVLAYEGVEPEPWVSVTMIGFARQRKQVVRDPMHPGIAVVDFTMQPFVASLAATRIVAARNLPTRDIYRSVPPGGSELTVDRSGAVSGRLDGDLTAALGGVPGVILKTNPDGSQTASAFGLGSDQNGATLNGVDFTGVLPRDGLLQTVRMSTYDPRNGRFGGVQVNSTLGSGMAISVRTGRITFDLPALQLSPSNAAAIGRGAQDLIASGTAAGALVGTRMYWSSSAQLQQRSSQMVTLGSMASRSWEGLNISADSSARLRAIASMIGLPLHAGGTPANLVSTKGSGILRVDFTPNAQAMGNVRGNIFYLLAAGSWRDLNGAGGNPVAADSRLLQSRQRQGQLLLSFAPYFGSFLSESRTSFSASEESMTPYLRLPSAQLQVDSRFPNGASRLVNLELGGGSRDRRLTTATWQGSTDLSWMSMNAAHRFNLFADARWQRFSLRENSNALGVFSYNSLAELELGRPTAFFRSAERPASNGSLWQGVLAFSDLWYASALARENHSAAGNGLTVQYGVRVNAERFSPSPAYNPQIASLFGRRNNLLPDAISVEPMIGFTRNDGVYAMSKGAGSYTLTRSQLDGGLRIYRGTLSALSVDAVSRQTGLPASSSGVQCVGGAVPTPDWPAYTSSTVSIPQQCANGAPPSFGGTAYPVRLFGPAYRIPESWRGELKWTWLFTGWLSGDLGVSYASNRFQTATSNLNFAGQPRFQLAREGGRAVFVSPEGVDPASGQVSSVESRVASGLAEVTEVNSTGASVVRGFTVGMTYRLGTSRFPTWEPNPARFHASVRTWYSYADKRELLSGFDGTTAGDPRSVAWLRGDLPTHTIQISVDSHLDRWFDLSFSARLSSGTPFTPMVNGDINGDGRANDRAFIFDPSAMSDTSLRGAMSSLLIRAPDYARRCLARQLGALAGVRSCMSGWTSSIGTISLAIDPFRIGLGNRGTLTIYVQNALGGLDQLIHGEQHLRGWGDPAYADPVLLLIRGFDRTANEFKYAANPQFGTGDAFRAAVRQPTKVSIDVRLNLHRNFETQSIEGSIKYFPGQLTVPALKEFLVSTAKASGEWAMDRILRRADSLQLDERQRVLLHQLDDDHAATRDSIYGGLAAFLVAQNGKYGTELVRARWHRDIAQAISATFRDAASARAILTEAQMRWLRSHRLAWTLERSPDWLELTTRGSLTLPR